MNHTMNLYHLASNEVEYKVGFNDKNTITGGFKLIVSRYPAKKGMGLQMMNAFVELFDKIGGMGWTSPCNPVED